MDVLSPDEIEQVLVDGWVVHVAVVDDGRPYVSPMSYIYSDGAIAFRTVEGRRIEALRANPAICMEVTRYDDETGDWWSVIAQGSAEFIEDDLDSAGIIAELLHKYSGSFAELFPMPDRGIPTVASVVKMHIDEVDSRCSGRLTGVKTRPGRL